MLAELFADKDKGLVGLPDELARNVILILPLFIPAKHEIAYGAIRVKHLDTLMEHLSGLEIFDRKHKFEILLPGDVPATK